MRPDRLLIRQPEPVSGAGAHSKSRAVTIRWVLMHVPHDGVN
jgi:hypothetical protein